MDSEPSYANRSHSKRSPSRRNEPAISIEQIPLPVGNTKFKHTSSMIMSSPTVSAIKGSKSLRSNQSLPVNNNNGDGDGVDNIQSNHTFSNEPSILDYDRNRIFNRELDNIVFRIPPLVDYYPTREQKRMNERQAGTFIDGSSFGDFDDKALSRDDSFFDFMNYNTTIGNFNGNTMMKPEMTKEMAEQDYGKLTSTGMFPNAMTATLGNPNNNNRAMTATLGNIPMTATLGNISNNAATVTTSNINPMAGTMGNIKTKRNIGGPMGKSQIPSGAASNINNKNGSTNDSLGKTKLVDEQKQREKDRQRQENEKNKERAKSMLMIFMACVGAVFGVKAIMGV